MHDEINRLFLYYFGNFLSSFDGVSSKEGESEGEELQQRAMVCTQTGATAFQP